MTWVIQELKYGTRLLTLLNIMPSIVQRVIYIKKFIPQSLPRVNSEIEM